MEGARSRQATRHPFLDQLQLFRHGALLGPREPEAVPGRQHAQVGGGDAHHESLLGGQPVGIGLADAGLRLGEPVPHRLLENGLRDGQRVLAHREGRGPGADDRVLAAQDVLPFLGLFQVRDHGGKEAGPGLADHFLGRLVIEPRGSEFRVVGDGLPIGFHQGFGGRGAGSQQGAPDQEQENSADRWRRLRGHERNSLI